MSILLVFTTTASKEEAQRITRALIEEQLAACAQSHLIQSTYTWKGEVVQEQEYRILFKTRVDLFERLSERLKELHTYELPAIVALESSRCDEDFATWVKDQTLGA